MALPPVRAFVLVMALACAVLLLRSPTTEAAAAPAPKQAVSSGAAKPKCVPGAANDKACRVGVVHDPENQEEEAAFSRRATAPAAAPDAENDDDYSDPDIPNNDRLEVVGH
ncbi:hypothetical protein PR202_ga14874 [Eleusine coracana subsp. coracana]|uniref:Uncharacterized protein n=1 Tax=Eleusine coracana subsp. coracana TaxID=191504 RepID=A0AAV5CHK8_ELECO|nr:hypothetical protein QOZ80_6BG0499280 [Eleusine coracana subsp. coracana]KAK3134168.1 hypothetical protein QOZ80_6AG0545850 [Eleusine coracana subsp. coracana]GJM97912.1 hypothetical protein PR202_ga14874 [Eleusine coracana subsp. coracana]